VLLEVEGGEGWEEERGRCYTERREERGERRGPELGSPLQVVVTK
jgi:hypothetical protein